MRFRALCALVLLAAWPLQATTVKRLDLDGLVRTAHTIVVGQVESTESYWMPDRELILTRSTIRVKETFKGAEATRIDVTTVGGSVDGITLYVAGMPEFVSNEEAVVFLEGDGRYRTVVGLGQGKFAVDEGMVSNDVSGLEFEDGLGPAPTEMSLEAFREEIQRRVRPF